MHTFTLRDLKMDINVSKPQGIVKEQEAQHAAVHEVTKNRT